LGWILGEAVGGGEGDVAGGGVFEGGSVGVVEEHVEDLEE